MAGPRPIRKATRRLPQRESANEQPPSPEESETAMKSNKVQVLKVRGRGRPRKTPNSKGGGKNAVAPSLDRPSAPESPPPQDEMIVIDLGNPNKTWKPHPVVTRDILCDELMKCQLCLKFFPNCAGALACLSSHGGNLGVLRCYCCFKIFVDRKKMTSTRQLRKHYEMEHNAVDETVICPYCTDEEEVLPFPLVSAHIVGSHGPLPTEQAVRAKEANITGPVRINSMKKSGTSKAFRDFPKPTPNPGFVNPSRFTHCEDEEDD